MARTASSRPVRTLGVLVALVALLYGLVGSGVLWSKAQWTPKLALDLQGGAEIVLEPVLPPGTKGPITQTAIDQAIEIMRQRINGGGVSEAEITRQGNNNIVVSLPGTPSEKEKDLVKQAAQLQFRAVLAIAEGDPAIAAAQAKAQADAQAAATATPTPSTSGTAKPSASGPTKPTANATVKSGTATPAASSNGRAIPKALVRMATPSATSAPKTAATTAPTPSGTAGATPGATATAAASPSPTAQPKPTNASDTNWITNELAASFEKLDCTKKENLQGGNTVDAKVPMVACDKVVAGSTSGVRKYILGPAELIGTDISSAAAALATTSQGATTGDWQVDLSFSGPGTKKFGAVTSRLAGIAKTDVRNQFAIVLDGLVVSAPQTNEAIVGGSAQITGTFTQDEAQTLANQLKFGALPISFKVQTDNTISATLGSEQLQRGLLAGLIGLVLVVLYSLVQYRALGLVTVASLVIAGSITYGLVVLLGWRQGYRLSLPGVTGLIVSIGITADSFIVYFERVRDEVRDGRSLRAAVEAAWVRARRTILASDAINFLAAIVLYLLAVSGVRGFAFTLGLTTIVDIIVVFLFTKPMVTLLSRTHFFGGGHKLSGFDPVHLGRPIAYAGRGRVRSGTIAERRAADERASREPVEDPPDAEPGGDQPSERWVDEQTAVSGRES